MRIKISLFTKIFFRIMPKINAGVSRQRIHFCYSINKIMRIKFSTYIKKIMLIKIPPIFQPENYIIIPNKKIFKNRIMKQ